MSQWAVIGDGGWGTALAARLLAAGQQVHLVGEKKRRPKLPAGVVYGVDPSAAVRVAERVVIAVPPHMLEALLRSLAPHLQGNHRVVTTARGLTPETHLRASEAVRMLTAVRQLAVLAGAADAVALQSGSAAALVVGSAFPAWADEIQDALAADTLRVYTNTDPVGVELSNALALVLGVALAAARAINVGATTEATALTRALAEMDRLAQGLGGRANTAYGLAGLGVLAEIVLQSDGPSGRAGHALARGDLKAARAEQEVLEISRTFAARARHHGLRAPMVLAVDALLQGKVSAAQAISGLMSRASRAE